MTRYRYQDRTRSWATLLMLVLLLSIVSLFGAAAVAVAGGLVP